MNKPIIPDERTPTRFDLSTFRGRVYAQFDMLAVDHGIFRYVWPNRYAVSDEMYRSGLPLPFHIAQAARRGVKTIINLRGFNDSGWYYLEAEACRRHGIELVDLPVSSRDMPKKDMLLRCPALFDSIAYPALMHCKSGSDRVGLMSVLYLILRRGQPLDTALEQLGLRYGHVKQSKTGMIDFFFDAYRQYNKVSPIGFMEWVETVYDPAMLKDSFHSQWWANALVDKILMRE